DDRADALLAEGEDALDATVVELDALANAHRAATYDQDLSARDPPRFSRRLVRRVVVRRLGLELPSARVDHLVRDPGPRPAAGFLRAGPERGDHLVRKAQPLRICHDRPRTTTTSEAGFEIDEGSALLEEERVPVR